MTTYVAVLGPARAAPDARETAEAVGRELARREAIVVTGGRGGVMEAASRGAFQAGGVTVGILPGPSREDANDWLTVAIPTAMGELRNGLVVTAADAAIAIGGGYGTLSEIGFAVRIGRPVVGLGTWEDEAIVPAEGVLDAVERALGLAEPSG